MGTSTLCLLLLLVIASKIYAQSKKLTATAGTNDCRQEFVIAFTEEDGDVGISLLYENADISANSAPSQNHVQLTVSGHQLSAECGDKFFRCQDLLVVSTPLNKTFTQHLLFVPLSDGLLIVELLHDGLSLSFNQQHILDTSLPASYHCSPVASYAILHGIYVVCVDSERRYVSLSYINLNKTSIKHSSLSYPNIEYRFEESEDMKTLSNFVYVEVDSNTERIYFTIGNRMYSINPLLDILNDDLGNIGNNCTHVTTLEYLGGRLMRAYCNHVYVNYNLDYEDWVFQWWNDIDGIAYSCPNSKLHLNVFKNSVMYIRFNINSQVGNINIPGENFDKGVCFGAADRLPLFAYSDINEGVYIVDLNTTDVMYVSSTPCDPTGCLPLMVFGDRYLVVRESYQNDGALYVLDSEKNLSKIIVVQHTVPKLLTLINDTDKRCQQNTTEIDVIPTEINVIPLDEGTNVGAVVGSIVGVVVFIVLGAVLVGAAIVYMWHQRKPFNLSVEVSGDGDNKSESGHAVGFAVQKSDDPRKYPAHLPPTTVPIQTKTTTPIAKDSVLVTTPTSETEEGKRQTTKRVGNSDEANIGHQETVKMLQPYSTGSSARSLSKENIGHDVKTSTSRMAGEGSNSDNSTVSSSVSPQENLKTEDDSESSISSIDDDKAPLINNGD